MLAAHIQGEYTGPPLTKLPDAKAPQPAAKDANVNVVLVADVDMISDLMFVFREQGDNGLEITLSISTMSRLPSMPWTRWPVKIDSWNCASVVRSIAR